MGSEGFNRRRSYLSIWESDDALCCGAECLVRILLAFKVEFEQLLYVVMEQGRRLRVEVEKRTC